jgi:Matrixin
MFAKVRLVVGVSAALAMLGMALPAAAVGAELDLHELRIPVSSRPGSAGGGGGGGSSSPNPCADNAFNLLGGSQPDGSYRWAFNAASTPAYLDRASVRNVLIESFSNVTGVNNDCGLPDQVSATHTYLGKTSVRAKCNQRDSRNVIGFKPLPFGVLAVTCFWTTNGRIVEADMQITTRERWALSLASCFNEMMLEATITHEAGHVFGLDHIGERRHGRLTMSPFIDGPCDNNEATLGLGDVRGLEAMY